jgi:hypothetical protein
MDKYLDLIKSIEVELLSCFPLVSCIDDKRDFWESDYDFDLMNTLEGDEYWERGATYMLFILKSIETTEA